MLLSVQITLLHVLTTTTHHKVLTTIGIKAAVQTSFQMQHMPAYPV
jgi:hypothetical protein